MTHLSRLATVQTDGVVTHVIVPIEEFRRLSAGSPESSPPTSDQVDAAIAVWNSKQTKWTDAAAVFEDILRDGIKHARRARRVSQQDLGEHVGLSQPQVSRIERHPQDATLDTLRRIAAALANSPLRSTDAAPPTRPAHKRRRGRAA
jgi:ribosome-binding protein aMBF1 (putative translation factor)